MVNNNLNEINAVIDSSQKITASGGFWWLKRFMERLGIGSVFNQDYGIKKRRREFSERDYFLSLLYLLSSGGNRHFDTLEKQLKEYFDGQRKEFDIPLVLPGTPFQKKAWEALLAIPYGETRSYSEQAKAIRKPCAPWRRRTATTSSASSSPATA